MGDLLSIMAFAIIGHDAQSYRLRITVNTGQLRARVIHFLHRVTSHLNYTAIHAAGSATSLAECRTSREI